MRKKMSLLAVLLSAALGGCGGGGGDSSTVCRASMLHPDACLTDAATGSVLAASLKLSLLDSSGATITQISPERTGTLQVLVKDGKGVAAPNVAVTYTSTDKTGVFIPSSGTALTDASGVAQVRLPAGTQAGGFTATASATVGSTTVTGTTGYAVTLPTLTLSPLSITPAVLSAGGTTSLGVTVLNGSIPFAPAQSVSFSSPCAVAGKATISSPVITVNGVASTSYTDKGCGGADTVTAASSRYGTTITQTGTITVLAATAGQIAFVSALPQNIAIKGTGGAGRQESSTVTFKVLDKNGNPVSGQLVNLDLTTYVGGLTRNPVASTTGADGTVSTVVAAGTVNTPVRVTATLAGTLITTLSDQLVVSTGIPDQNSFSLSTAIYNVEGMNHDGCEAPVGSSLRVSLADHFNNPAPDGTAVSFTAEGGTVDASCLTGLVNTTLTDGSVIKQKGIPGQCSVRFCPASPRPADGRITILAYALGEESFVDTNGNNLFEPPVETFQDLGEPFRNDRAITDRNANANWGVLPKTNAVDANGNPVVTPSLAPLDPDDIWSKGNANREPGETFIDTNLNGSWAGIGDGKYNGVLKSPQTFDNQATHVRGALVQVLSTSQANFTPLDPVPVTLSHCVDGIPFVNVPKTLRIAIRDGNLTVFAANKANTFPLFLAVDLPGNILPAGTTIAFTASNGTILSGKEFVVPNTNEPSAAVWTYPVVIGSDATQSSSIASPPLECSNPVTSGRLNVKVITPLGLVSSQSYAVTD